MIVELERTKNRHVSRERVKDVARRLHVHYDVRPESTAWGDHSTRQVGFVLELHAGAGEDSGGRFGDDRCREAILRLLEISSLLVPVEGDCSYEVSGSPTAFYNLGGPQGGQGCVRLDIRVHGREGALRELEDRLRALGVPGAYGPM